MKTLMIAMGLFLVMTLPASAQNETEILNEAERVEAIDNICRLLGRFYVLPEVAVQIKEHIRTRLADGAFEAATDPRTFAKIVTEELHHAHHDKHLFVFIGPNPDNQTNEERALERILRQFDNKKNNYGLKKAEILDGNVGYLDIHSVMYSEESMDVLFAALDFMKNTEAMIFDLRLNRGGDPMYMANLFSYFFNEPTHINSVYWRDRDRTDEYWTHEIPPQKRMADIPLFVLISNQTFSGAEEFAYDLQTLERAVIVGEVSAGGANPAQTWVVYENIRISIPYGRAINPITGTNWEGVGVNPDIEVSAEYALEVAMEKAKSAAFKLHTQKKTKLKSEYSEYADSLRKATTLLNAGDVESAEDAVARGLKQALACNLVDQSSINELGYDYLGQENTDLAVAVFKFNVSAFPESVDVYDSLGEAYAECGNKQLAIENYRKALEIEPQYATAIRALKDLLE